MSQVESRINPQLIPFITSAVLAGRFVRIVSAENQHQSSGHAEMVKVGGLYSGPDRIAVHFQFGNVDGLDSAPLVAKHGEIDQNEFLTMLSDFLHSMTGYSTDTISIGRWWFEELGVRKVSVSVQDVKDDGDWIRFKRDSTSRMSNARWNQV